MAGDRNSRTCPRQAAATQASDRMDHGQEHTPMNGRFTMSTTNMNGRVQRKTLANQLDRLDTILDGFADALNEAVADAVKQAVVVAVREAVQVAMQEVLTNPELLRALVAQTTPAPTPTPDPVKKPSAL